MPLALLFIDGVGVGRKEPDENPLARRDFLLSRFEGADGAALPAGGVHATLDPTFGVPGRPQSASNQTAILTGLPAPRLIGRHVLGFPDLPLRRLLAEHSVPRQLAAAGRTTTFANAYPAAYLDLLGLKRGPSAQPDVVIPARARRRLRASASTLSMAAAGVTLRTLDQARRGRALTHDIDGSRAAALGLQVPRRTPQEAAEIFWRIAAEADFTLFEHYLADEAGHAQDAQAAVQALSTFDAFARAVAVNRPAQAHVLVCSDHGNVEDLRTRSHTLNRVPALYFGPAPEVLARLQDVADVGRAVLSLLGVPPPVKVLS
jgi:hypothetical protein